MTSFDHAKDSEYSVSRIPETEIPFFLVIVIRPSWHTSSVYTIGQQSMTRGSQKGRFWTTFKMWSF